MTDRTPDDAVIDEWLTDRHRAFTNSLAEHLDLDAGLREIMLDDRHDELVAGLGTKLDLDAGLAEILRGDVLEPPTPTANLGSVEEVKEIFAEMPVRERLQTRAKYPRRIRLLVRLARYLATGDSDQDLPLHTFQHFFHQAFPTYDRAYIHPGDLTDLLRTDEARLIARCADSQTGYIDEEHTDRDDLAGSEYARFVDAVHDLYGSATAVDTFDGVGIWQIKCKGSPVGTPVGEAWMTSLERFVMQDVGVGGDEERLREIADHLDECEHMLNDFVGVDLSAIDLTGIPLDGLRWSGSSTRWPVAWRERVKRDSVRVEDSEDLFEVRYGTQVNQDVMV